MFSGAVEKKTSLVIDCGVASGTEGKLSHRFGGKSRKPTPRQFIQSGLSQITTNAQTDNRVISILQLPSCLMMGFEMIHGKKEKALFTR
jgi:hypothetical protein